MRTKGSVLKSMGRLQKMERFMQACKRYELTPEAIDNIQVRVRMEASVPGAPDEIALELEPDSPEELAVIAILNDAIDKKKAKCDEEFHKHGLCCEDGIVKVKPKDAE